MEGRGWSGSCPANAAREMAGYADANPPYSDAEHRIANHSRVLPVRSGQPKTWGVSGGVIRDLVCAEGGARFAFWPKLKIKTQLYPVRLRIRRLLLAIVLPV